MNRSNESALLLFDDFLDSIRNSKQDSKTLILDSDLPIRTAIRDGITVFNIADGVPKCKEKFDFIFAFLPLGAHFSVYNVQENKEKYPGGWTLISPLMECLVEDGIGFFLTEPHGFTIGKGEKFKKFLNEQGYFINAFVNMPDGILYGQTSLRPILAVVSNKKTDYLYVSELDEIGSAASIADNLLRRLDVGSIRYGMITKDRFSGFDRLKARESIKKLETQYKLFKEFSLKEVSCEINAVMSGEQHEHKENSIYFPKIGTSKVITHIEDATIKHHNYFQVVLNEQVDCEYAALFFESGLGKLVRKSLTSSSFIPNVNKSFLSEALIAVPDKEKQREISLFHQKLDRLSKKIESFFSDVSVNPLGSKTMHSQIDSMLLAIDSLSKEDRIRSLIRDGESKVLEFKESFSLDVKKKTKEKYIEESCLKTIIAFLNSDGGTLIVGISDSGEIPGVDVEIEKFHKGSEDGLLKHVKNALKTRIGEQYYPFISYELVEVANRRVLEFNCLSSTLPCFLDENVFYVRTNPATDKLEGRKLSEYLQNHFKN